MIRLLSGVKLSKQILVSLSKEVNSFGLCTSLHVMLIGSDPASEIYVSLKEKAAKKVGIDFVLHRFGDEVSESVVQEKIIRLNSDDAVDAILVQLPLPKSYDTDRVVSLIATQKDADGFHPDNRRAFCDNSHDVLWPVFPLAIVRLLDFSEKNYVGGQAVVIGRSDVFLDTMACALRRKGLRVKNVSCEDVVSGSVDVSRANVVVTACGIPNLLRADHLSDNAIVIDGGVARVHRQVVGDVDRSSCERSQKHIILSPVPGGVGPVTVACLLENVVRLAS
ncbi:MAG: bifunctional 5,10-methylenetetrahydrofolate dehydrogenase/5,10-methenyltetrahydrofolate cyclohydrolase [Candidatus Moranbacteria bacterium]|nr:bifunctional 5,10-methylenetetrahydrofolate dehydrogenase/5,10-methenyltetrahydrofolate cyclohydrolase [Candidatus Moranbacteria bacterium]